MKILLTLELVNEPTSAKNIEIQKTIMNSHPEYNLVVVNREFLTDEEILEENKRNHELGEQIFHIKLHDECIGILNYLPRNPNDQKPWIGLFVIHRDHEGKGFGSEVLGIFEAQLREQDVHLVRLGVHIGNQ